MPVPSSREIRKILLSAYGDEIPHSFAIGDLLEVIAENLNRDVALNFMTLSEKNSFKNNVNEARDYLKRKKLLSNPSKNSYMITRAGLKVLREDPDFIDDDYLESKNKDNKDPLSILEQEPLSEAEEVVEEPEPLPKAEEVIEEQELLPGPEAEEVIEEPEFLPGPEAEEIIEEQEPLPGPEAEEVIEEPELLPGPEVEEVVEEQEPLPGPEAEEVIEEQELLPEPEVEEVVEEQELLPEPEVEEIIEEPEPLEEETPSGLSGHLPEGRLSVSTPQAPLLRGEGHEVAGGFHLEDSPEAEEESNHEIYNEQEEPKTLPENINEIEDVLSKYNEKLSQEILERVATLPPESFEMLVMDLLSKMGYRTFQNARYTNEAEGSDLIHGVILDNKPGLPPIYIQARLSSPSKTIGKADMQDFINAITDKGGKGIFATTASFSEQAAICANDERVMLLDGEKLAGLMIANNFCVNVEKIFELKTFDPESLNEYEA
ncbi:MAG: restriction endonuclease [Synergistaceae bacterium]|nr:restriction endonuclease [Synergistaceae bacterium]